MDQRFNTYPLRHAQQATNTQSAQRFSWQQPVDEIPHTTPVYHEVQQHGTAAGYPTYQERPQHGNSAGYPTYQEVQQQHGPVDAFPQSSFAHARIPAQHATRYTSNPSSPVFTPIDDRPQSMFPVLNAQGRRDTQPVQAAEEATLSPSSPEAQTLPFMLVESAVGSQSEGSEPQAQQSSSPERAGFSTPLQTRHARQMSNLSPINTNLPGGGIMQPIPQSPTALPTKTPISPISAAPIRKDTPNSLYKPYNNTHPASAHPPYTPHALAPPTTPHAIFSPSALSGPNGLDPSLHQPGQIRHPNMSTSSSRTWSSSLCSCTDIPTCLTGLFCPCILSGRTAHRLSLKSAGRDATDMLGHSDTNAHCVGMALACVVGLGWVVPMLQRVRVRHVYRLEGSCGGDLLRGCCCCWCVAVLNEREVRGREEGVKRWAGPAAGVGQYERGVGMQYVPQN